MRTNQLEEKKKKSESVNKKEDSWVSKISSAVEKSRTDPVGAKSDMAALEASASDPGSNLYNPYRKPTSSVVDNTTVNNTIKAKQEWSNAKRVAGYWAKRSDLNLPDDEIISRAVAGSPTLQAMDEGRVNGKPLPLLEPVGYSTDNLKGAIWAARNNGASAGDDEADAIQSEMGLGNQYKADADIESKRTYGSDSYDPYSFGSTMLDLAEKYDVTDFAEGMEVSPEDAPRVAEAEARTKEAEAESGILKQTVSEAFNAGATPEEVFEGDTLDGFPVLQELEAGKANGKPSEVTRSIDFNLLSLKNEYTKAFREKQIESAYQNAPENPESMSIAVEDAKGKNMAENGGILNNEMVPAKKPEGNSVSRTIAHLMGMNSYFEEGNKGASFREYAEAAGEENKRIRETEERKKRASERNLMRKLGGISEIVGDSEEYSEEMKEYLTDYMSDPESYSGLIEQNPNGVYSKVRDFVGYAHERGMSDEEILAYSEKPYSEVHSEMERTKGYVLSEPLTDEYKQAYASAVYDAVKSGNFGYAAECLWPLIEDRLAYATDEDTAAYLRSAESTDDANTLIAFVLNSEMMDKVDDPKTRELLGTYADFAMNALDIKANDLGFFGNMLDDMTGGMYRKTKDRESGVGFWEVVKNAGKLGVYYIYDWLANIVGAAGRAYAGASRAITQGIGSLTGIPVTTGVIDSIDGAFKKVADYYDPKLKDVKEYMADKGTFMENLLVEGTAQSIKMAFQAFTGGAISNTAVGFGIGEEGMMLTSGSHVNVIQQATTLQTINKMETARQLASMTPFVLDSGASEFNETLDETGDYLTAAVSGVISAGCTLATSNLEMLKTIENASRGFVPELASQLTGIEGVGWAASMKRYGKGFVEFLFNGLKSCTNEGLQEISENILTTWATSNVKGDDFFGDIFFSEEYRKELMQDGFWGAVGSIGTVVGAFPSYTKTAITINAQMNNPNVNPQEAIMSIVTAIAEDMSDPKIAEAVNANLHEMAVSEAELNIAENSDHTAVMELKRNVDAARTELTNTVNRKNEIDSKVSSLANDLKNLNAQLSENPADTEIVTEIKHKSRQLRQQKENAFKAQTAVEEASAKAEAAQSEYDSAIEQSKAELREQAETEVKAREAEQKTAEETERERYNRAKMIADKVAETFYPNATEEDKARILQRTMEKLNPTTVEASQENQDFANRLAERFGLTIRFEDSEGKYSGYHQGNEIVLDKNATAGDAIYQIALHELTHQAEKSGFYEEFASSMKELYDGDIDADVAATRELYKMKLIENGMTEAEAEATVNQEGYIEKEVIADMTKKILYGDKKLIEKLVREKPNLLERIVEWFEGIIDKLHGIDDPSYEQLNKTRDLFVKALDDAKGLAEPVGDTRYSIQSMTNGLGMVAKRGKDGMYHFYDNNGREVREVTNDHIENSATGMLLRMALTNGATDESGYLRQVEGIRDIMNTILRTQNSEMVWSFVGSELFSALKSNSDPQYGTTIDFTTVCRKTQEMITAMSIAMMELGRGLTKEEVTQLQNKLHNNGAEVPCPVCYVFSRWSGCGNLLDGIRDLQNKYDPSKVSTEEIQNAFKFVTKEADAVAKKEGVKSAAAKSKLAERLEGERSALDSELTAMQKTGKDKTPDGMKRVAEIEARAKELDLEIGILDKYTWFKDIRTRSDYGTGSNKAVPNEVLYNLDGAEEFSREYPLAWKYRSTRGPSAGKSILPYSDFRMGDFISGDEHGTDTGKSNWMTKQSYTNDEGEEDTYFKPRVGKELNKTQTKELTKAIARTRAKNLIGGQRLQSTSDFRYDYALDYFQYFIEAQALGSNMQSYTKIVEFAELIAKAGGDVNLSLMPKGFGIKDGKLDFSNVTGIDFEAAKKARASYNGAQTILVGINDDHINMALMNDGGNLSSYVDMVIPYHASGASTEFISALVSNLGEKYEKGAYMDYSPVQTDHERSDASEDELRSNELREKLLTGKVKKEDGKGKKAWKPGAEDIAFMESTKESKDISGMSFEELREIEKKALSGDTDAIAEYKSWTQGALWNLYQKLWVDQSSKDTYGVRLSGSQTEAVMPHEYWNKSLTKDKAYINGFLFRSYCYNIGLVPRFTGIKSDGNRATTKVVRNGVEQTIEYGDFSDNPGYYKTLIDRPMYDNDGNYREQTKCNLNNIGGEMLQPEWQRKNWGDTKTVGLPDPDRASRVGTDFANELSGEKQFSMGTGNVVQDLLDTRIDTFLNEKGAESDGVPSTATDEDVQNELDEVLSTKSPDGKGKSQFAVQTGINTPLLDNDTKMAILNDPFYDTASMKGLAELAMEKIESEGFDNRLKSMNEMVITNRNALATPEVQAELSVLAEVARKAGDTEAEASIAFIAKDSGTVIGQSLAMRKLWLKMSPEGSAHYVDKVVKSLNTKYGKRMDSKITVPTELKNELINAKTEEEKKNAISKIAKHIADQIPPSVTDRVNTWRYLCMLANPLTHFKNMLANAAFYLETRASDALSATLQERFNKENQTRTAKVKDEYMVYAKNIARTYRSELEGDHYTGDVANDLRGEIENERRKASKLVDWLSRKNGDLLGYEDIMFRNLYYARSLAEYLQTHDYDLGVVTEEKAEKKNKRILTEGMEFARKEAFKKTFNNINAFSVMLNKWEKAANESESSGLRAGAKIGFAALVPFKNTPANVLMRGLEYSPIGLVEALSVESMKLAKGKITMNQYLDRIANGLTGTGIAMVGALLQSMGVLHIGGEDEDKYLDRNNYSIDILGFNVGIDSIGSSVMPLFVGANFYNELSKNGFNFTSILNALAGSGDSIMNMSMLQGIDSALKVYNSSDSSNTSIGKVAQNAMQTYISQLFPSIGGAVARTLDDTRRTTYDEGTLETSYLVQSIVKKIPILEQMLPAKQDAWGNDVSNGNPVFRFMGNFIIPGYPKPIRTMDDVDELLFTIMDDDNVDKSVLPKMSDKTIKISGETVKMSAQQYHDFNANRGDIAHKVLELFTNDVSFRDLNPDEQADIFTNVYSLTNYITKYNCGVKNSAGDTYYNNTYKALMTGYSDTDEAAKIVYNYMVEKQEGKKMKADKEKRKDDLTDHIGSMLSVSASDWTDDDITTLQACVQSMKDANQDANDAITRFLKPKYQEAYRNMQSTDDPMEKARYEQEIAVYERIVNDSGAWVRPKDAIRRWKQ